MKKMLFGFSLFAALILCVNNAAIAKLFIVEIDGDKVVVDFYVESEQEWQNTQEGEDGWWDGLAPHPYECRIWYPFLSETFDMDLSEQLEWIDELNYAGITDWRIATYWDAIPLKASMFGSLTLGLPMPNMVFNFNTDVYFPPTASGMGGFGGQQAIVLGRTGNEDGLLTGAIINPMEGFPGDPNQRYVDEGAVARTGGMADVWYTLPRSEAQDHWICFPDKRCIYNDDLNYNQDDTTIGLMSPPDDVTGKQPIGAWVVTDAMPLIPRQIRKEFHTISISDVVNPGISAKTDPVSGDGAASEISAGTLISVTDVEIFQDEPVGRFAPDAVILQAAEAAYVKLRAERTVFSGDGRVYHISFKDRNGDRYTLKVGVPMWKCTTPVDGGALYNSTVD